MPPIPKLCYWRQSSIAWLLLHRRFLVAYSVQIEHAKADPLPKPHHAPHQNHSEDNPIYHFITAISDNFDCELFKFHLADNQLSRITCNLNPILDDDNETLIQPDPIAQLFALISSISDKVVSEVTTNTITTFDPANNNKDNGTNNASTLNKLPHVSMPQTQYKQTIDPPSRLGPPTHHVRKPPPPTLSSPLHLRRGMDSGTPCDSPWTLTNPPLPLLSNDQPEDNYYGCTWSLPNDENPPDQPLQPHDPVCGNTKRKKKRNDDNLYAEFPGTLALPKGRQGEYPNWPSPRSTQTRIHH